MRFGFNVPIMHEYADPALLCRLARDAERAGWDGFFLWDDVAGGPDAPPMTDPWIALAAIAGVTRSMRIGPMVAILPRRRPWKVARETVALDHLSGGRLILGAGIGDGPTEEPQLNEELDQRTRGVMLDEALDVITGLWSGESFSYSGAHYRLQDTRFLPRPVQSPRIPVWVGGAWPNKPPFRRAARWDGVCPLGKGLGLGEMMRPEQVREIAAYVGAHRTTTDPWDIVHIGTTSGTHVDADTAVVRAYADVGVTWWLENISPWAFDWAEGSPWPLEQMHHRILQGPPNL